MVAQIVYNIVGSTEMARPEGPKPDDWTAKEWSSEGPEDRVLGEGMFPSHQLGDMLERYKLRNWGLEQSPGDVAI